MNSSHQDYLVEQSSDADERLTPISTKADMQSIKEWYLKQRDAELARLKQLKQPCIPISVRNTSVLREQHEVTGTVFVNRIEMDTGMDFDKIQQILISDPVQCPLDPTIFYVNVVLFTDKPLPIVVGHLYSMAGDHKANDLREWLLVSKSNIMGSRHHVNIYSDVKE